MTATLTLANLPATVTRLQALRGLKIDALQAIRCDDLLDELVAEVAALAEIERIRNDIIDLADGLEGMTELLGDAEEKRYRAGRLCSMLRPLVDRISRLSTDLEPQVPHIAEIRSVVFEANA